MEGLAPFKRKLAEITDEEWEAIPEIGDYTIKKTRRFESFVPVPDTLLAKAAAEKVRLMAWQASRFCKLSHGLLTVLQRATWQRNQRTCPCI